jgi:hypothetical protein
LVAPGVHQAFEESPGGKHHCPGRDRATIGDQSGYTAPLNQKVQGLPFGQHKAGRGFHDLAHALLVTVFISLGPRSPYGRAFPGVETAELNATGIYGPSHLTTKGINLADQVAFADAADGRVARHLSDAVTAQREHEGAETRTCRGQGGLNARMPGPNDDYIEAVH